MKSVLISIQPQWCELIASGKKTIEVRKAAPKETPFKVYIYQSKWHWIYKILPWLRERRQKVIGEFVCDKVEKFEHFVPYEEEDEMQYNISQNDLVLTCIEPYELTEYGKGKTLYGWHITDLKIYDKPKELSEFYTLGNCEKYDFCNQCKNFHRGQYWLDGSYCDEDSCIDNTRIPVTRAPQSWCYVEER